MYEAVDGNKNTQIYKHTNIRPHKQLTNIQTYDRKSRTQTCKHTDTQTYRHRLIDIDIAKERYINPSTLDKEHHRKVKVDISKMKPNLGDSHLMSHQSLTFKSLGRAEFKTWLVAWVMGGRRVFLRDPWL